jgi:hypothetical protein
MDYACGNCLAKAWSNYDDTEKQCCNIQCSQFGLWIPTGKEAKKEYSEPATIFLDSKPNEKRSEEIETVTLQIPWENLPGFSWSSSYSDAEDIKQKVSDAILFEGTGWYPSMTLGCEEISLIIENNGKLDFYHFEFDPRKFKILVEIPFLGYPQK